MYYENKFESSGAFELIPGLERIGGIVELISKLLDNGVYMNYGRN